MKVKVDFDKCKGVAMCESLAPDFFEVQDNGFLEVLREDIDEASLAQVEEAVAACPNQAISIET